MQNQNVYKLRFSFHPLASDPAMLALYCPAAPYTVGNYHRHKGAFIARSYVFLAGHGTPTKEKTRSFKLESQARAWLMKRATLLVFAHHYEAIPS